MQQDVRVSFPDFMRFLGRGLPIAVAGALLCGAAAAWMAERRDPDYETRATVLATQPEDDGAFEVAALAPGALDVNAYKAVATSDPLLSEVLEATGVDTTQREIRALRGRLTLRTEETRISSLIHVDVQGRDPVEIAEIANQVAASLVHWDRRRALATADRVVERLQAQIKAMERQIASLQATGETPERIAAEIRLVTERQAQLTYLQAIADTVPGLLQIIQPAPVPLRPSSPSQRFFVAIGSALGFALTYSILLVRELTVTRIRDIEELGRVSGLPVLAGYPRARRGNRRLPLDATSYLRANLMLRLEPFDSKVVLVTSARRGDGKSSVCISLAESLAKAGLRTLLIDADTRRPVIGAEYGLDGGTTTSARKSSTSVAARGNEPVTVVVDAERSLDVVASVRPFTYQSELSGALFGEAIRRWQKKYDVVIVDSGPILSVADPLLIAPFCTGTILVASVRGTEQGLTHAAKEMLMGAGVHLLGVVATQVPRGFRSTLRYDPNPRVEWPVGTHDGSSHSEATNQPLRDPRVRSPAPTGSGRRR